MPLPSLFFIGKNGTPIEIVTGVTKTVEELNSKIDNVLVGSKSDVNPSAVPSVPTISSAATSSANLIASMIHFRSIIDALSLFIKTMLLISFQCRRTTVNIK